MQKVRAKKMHEKLEKIERLAASPVAQLFRCVLIRAGTACGTASCELCLELCHHSQGRAELASSLACHKQCEMSTGMHPTPIPDFNYATITSQVHLVLRGKKLDASLVRRYGHGSLAHAMLCEVPPQTDAGPSSNWDPPCSLWNP